MSLSDLYRSLHRLELNLRDLDLRFTYSGARFDFDFLTENTVGNLSFTIAEDRYAGSTDWQRPFYFDFPDFSPSTFSTLIGKIDYILYTLPSKPEREVEKFAARLSAVLDQLSNDTTADSSAVAELQQKLADAVWGIREELKLNLLARPAPALDDKIPF